jgi:hypothetical protein
MAFVSDVKSAFLNQTGFILDLNRSRLKSVGIQGTSNAGQVDIFATDTAPVSATYGQAGNVITVSSTAHGLVTGQKIGIAYSAGTGGTSMCGNNVVTVVDANTFTLPCINSFTITGTPACRYVADGEWLMTFTTAATDIFHNYFRLPEDGVLATKKVFCSISNISAVTVFHA